MKKPNKKGKKPIWPRIALSLKKWRELNPIYTSEQEKDVFGKFISISLGIQPNKDLMDIYMNPI